MESRLVEQHRAFTPLPLSSFWCACVVSLLLSFCLFPLWTLLYWIKSKSKLIILSAPPTVPYACFMFLSLSIVLPCLYACVHTVEPFIYTIAPASSTCPRLQLPKSKKERTREHKCKAKCIVSSWMHNLKIQCWEKCSKTGLLYYILCKLPLPPI